MNKLFEIAAKIQTELSLVAFAIAALLFLASLFRRGKVPKIAWGVIVAIVALAALPIAARSYLGANGIYRVRVVVLDDRKMPTNDAKVTCSVGGEVKKIEGGWECDIPSKTKPTDGKMHAYATEPNAFLTGRAEVELKDDYNPLATIQLKQDTTALVLGIVMDESNQPVEGAHVGVVGYDAEAVTTKPSGGFSVPAHKASGQQVQIFAFKDGYTAGPPEWHQAGDHPVTIVLRNKASSKRKHI
jgi:hypothetical protein